MDLPYADDPSWEADIVKLEQRSTEAFLERDLRQLDALFSDELLINSPINRIHDKAKLLSLLGAGVIGHVYCKVEHEVIRRDGDLVIVMGSDVIKDTPSGPTVRRRFTNVWRKEAGGWRLFVRHANVIGEANK